MSERVKGSYIATTCRPDVLYQPPKSVEVQYLTLENALKVQIKMFYFQFESKKVLSQIKEDKK